jgi:outer membrane immunogenic protein
MGFRRALTLAIVATWGLGAPVAPAGAHGPADDYVPYQPSGFFVYDWSGFYAGGHLGLAHTSAEATEVVFPESLEFFQSLSLEQSETSVTGGLQGGWQKHWGKLVAGAEIGFSLLRFDNTEASPLIDGLFRSAELSSIFTLTGRLGYADGRWLAYAKGGLATAEVDVRYRDTFTGLSSSSSGHEIGWTAGLGIDYALTHNWIIGIEYNYVHFRAGIEPPPIFNPATQQVIPTEFGGVDVDVQNLVVRLNYRFGGACCTLPGGN